MPRRHRHVTRIFDGEKEGRNLCDWLNRNPKLSYSKRIATLIENIHKGWPAWGVEDLEMMASRKFPIRILPNASALRKVEKELSRHKMRPALMGYSAGPDKPKNHKPHVHSQLLWTWVYGKDPATHAVHLVMQLGEAGLFDRIKQCRKCTAWFFARFRHQVFCSEKCQIAHYRRTDKFKAHHRDYTRALRRRKRQGK